MRLLRIREKLSVIAEINKTNALHRGRRGAGQTGTVKPATKIFLSHSHRLWCSVWHLLSKENPAGAAKIVAEGFLPGGLQEEAAMSVLHQWALRDASAAAAWAQLFPDGAVRDRAIREVQNVTAVRVSGHPDPVGDAL